MRGILIDPFAKTITETTVEKGLQPIYDAIKADCFDVVGLPREDALYVDDEGLFKRGQDFFAIGGYRSPIAGRALILGTNDEGESVDAKCSLDWVRGRVRWLQPAEVVEMHNRWLAAAHANAAITNAKGNAFGVVCAPKIEIDPDTGKAIGVG